MMAKDVPTLPFKISVLVFLHDASGRLLLIERTRPPNEGCWSPIGGKLEMARGESPFECAVRETAEETGLRLATADLHLWATVSEKAYEGDTHWLMFLFASRRALAAQPPDIGEGRFGLYTREEVDRLRVPESDRELIWPFYDTHRERFIALRADCSPERKLQIQIEESH